MINLEYKIGDLFEFIRNGANIKQGIPGGYPITRIETISEGVVNREKMGYAGIEDITPYKNYILANEDILISHINSEKHLGKSALYLKKENEQIIHGMNLLGLRARKEILLPKFAIYLFQTINFKKSLNKIIKKSVNQASFAVNDLKKIKVSVPNIQEQERIVNVLEKCQNLIRNRQSQIVALDELINSYFYETLKGDLKSLILEDLIVTTQNGMSRRGDDENGQIVLKLKNIKNNEVNFDTINRIYLTERETNTYEINEQDLLVVRVNGNPKYVGRSAVFKGYGEPLYFNDHIIRVVVANVNAEYLSYLLNSNLGISEIQKNIKTSAGQYTISRDGLNKIKLRLPHGNVQSEFKRKKDIIDLKKAKLKDSLEELDILYNSLFQKAFKGELFQTRYNEYIS